jgi:hypothetical protein
MALLPFLNNKIGIELPNETGGQIVPVKVLWGSVN